MSFSNIEIIVSEIDGVITNGCDAIDYMNNTMFKTFCMRDFEAIDKLKEYFTFVFLASDHTVSYNIMRMRNIPAYFATKKDNKLSILTKNILPRYNTRPENLLYVGSSLSDLPCMHLAQISMAPVTTSVFGKGTMQPKIESGAGYLSWIANILLHEEMAARKRKY